MAQATVQTETVKTITGVTLSLSVDEALAVHAVLGKVGGISEGRNHTDHVYGAIRQALMAEGMDVATYRDSHRFAVEPYDSGLRFQKRGSL